MFNYIKSFLPTTLSVPSLSFMNGTSTEHFKSAYNHAYKTPNLIYTAGTNFTKAGGNIFMTGVQTLVASGAFEVASGKFISVNAVLQTATAVSNYIAPTAISTKVLGAAATCSGIAAKFLVTHPISALGVTVGSYLIYHPEYIKGSALNIADGVYNASKAGYELGASAGEFMIGQTIYAKENVQKMYNFFNPASLDSQKAVKGYYSNTVIPQTDIEGASENITSSNDYVFIENLNIHDIKTQIKVDLAAEFTELMGQLDYASHTDYAPAA